MFRIILFCALILTSGCTARTFIAEQKSADTLAANPNGNRGYLMGKPPQDTREPKPRRVPTLEVELGGSNPAEKKQFFAPYTPVKDYEVSGPSQAGNPSSVASITIPQRKMDIPEQYTVQSGDTLQKISQKLYGTTKKWHKLYLLNKDILKSPDKVHPGMVIKTQGKEEL